MGAKLKHLLLKLQRYDGSESLETFLLKFQHLAAYLQWNEEDRSTTCVRVWTDQPVKSSGSCHRVRRQPT